MVSICPPTCAASRHLSEVSRPAPVFGAGGTFCRLEWLLVSGVSSCLWGLCHCHPVASPPLTGPVEQALGGWCPPPIKVSPLLLHMLTRQQEQEWTQYSSASSARSGLAGFAGAGAGADLGSSASLQNPNQHLFPPPN